MALLYPNEDQDKLGDGYAAPTLPVVPLEAGLEELPAIEPVFAEEPAVEAPDYGEIPGIAPLELQDQEGFEVSSIEPMPEQGMEVQPLALQDQEELPDAPAIEDPALDTSVGSARVTGADVEYNSDNQRLQRAVEQLQRYNYLADTQPYPTDRGPLRMGEGVG